MPKAPYPKRASAAKDSLAEYLELVDEQDRKKLSDSLLDIDFTDPLGIKEAHKLLLGATARGHLSPGVSAEIRVNLIALTEMIVVEAAGAFERDWEEDEDAFTAYNEVRGNDLEGGNTEGPE